MKMKRRNTVKIEVGPIKDTDGVTIVNLATADAVTFMVKQNQSDADADAKITETILGGGVTVDVPDVGYVTVDIEATETTWANFVEGDFYMALQIEWLAPGGNNIQEINLTENGRLISAVRMVDDVIVG